MRVFGIDLGLKRTGFAISDELGIAVKLLPAIEAKSRSQLVERILELRAEYGFNQIVLGLPENRTEQSKALITRIESLAHLLREQGFLVNLWDESFSSKRASENLVKAGVKKSERKRMLDSSSAAIIVEEFLYFYKAKNKRI